MTCEPSELFNTTFNCLFDGYLDVTTEAQLGMLVSVMFVVPLYAKYEDPIVPAVALALLAGAAFPVLPPQLAGVAWVILFIGLTIGVFAVMYRVVLT